MSNKKRISKRVESIQNKYNMKRLSFMCSWLVECIKAAQEVSIGLRKVSECYYPPGGFIPNNREPERIIDSHSDEMILQKFEIKRNPNFLYTHKPEQHGLERI